MRHTVRLSLLASMMVLSASAADDLAGMFKEGKASGQIRAFYIDRDYDGYTNATSVHRNATAIGGYLKYETGAWNGLNLGSAFYTTNGLFLKDKTTSTGADNSEVDPTLLGKSNESTTYLGEAYVQYKNGNTTFKGGRQKLDTPMAGSDDARMLPNLFEAYVLSNTDVKDTTLIAAHVTKFAQGSFGRVYNGGILSVTSGYSLVDSKTHVGEFVDMGTYAIGENTGGVSVAAAIYSGVPGLKLQVWDYYAHDILNAIYAEANYGWSYASGVAPYVAAQWINERDVGSNSVAAVKKVESDFIAAKMGVKVANFDVSVAASHNTKDSDVENGTHGGTISPWGGMPAYTQGMVTRHQFMAGTDAWKVAAAYDWKDYGVNLNTSVYYVEYDMDPLNGYSNAAASDESSESGFDIIYNPQAVKNLQLRLRANYARDFQETTAGDVSWDEYRVIANYNF
ncbi:MAG: OprD family outer membrane porin [Sulfuricurvum sp.]|uniref:OprD family outer membrane porin n=1 Tax=Sulfuricurvum sp. TaxID=2025608 RepID=UPI00271C10DB|nr:OprD family outer membrane porin [Sulfuricurvum sp.]MDO9055309.1 OprD family outer membrane porin [Sulfuricurvum sp.]